MQNTNKYVIEPWERHPDESAKAFEAFAIYRDMGASRSIREVGQKLDKSRTQIGKWSVEYRWSERCSAWDYEQDRITREEQTKEILKMRKTHADLAVAMLVKAAKGLKELPEDEMGANEIARMVEVGSKLERLSRGEVTDKVENKTELSGEVGVTQVDLSQLNGEELRQFEELTRKLSSK